MLKIGEFSALAHITIKTLHHYDEVGLLKPLHVDTATGYRFYSVSQLPRLHRILALKDLGFPLDRIAETLNEGITADHLRGMLLLRQAEQEHQVHEEQERLNRLNALLHHIEQEGKMTSDVILKELEPQWIVSLRDHIPAYRTIGTLFARLYSMLGPLGSEGSAVALLHDTEFKDQNVDAEAGIYIKREATVPVPLQSYQLPSATVASIVHHGAFAHIGEAYCSLLRWIDANGYRSSGPTREIFLHVSTPVTREDESNVTEIQVPIAKA